MGGAAGGGAYAGLPVAGMPVFIEDPSYFLAVTMFKDYGYNMIPIDADKVHGGLPNRLFLIPARRTRPMFCRARACVCLVCCGLRVLGAAWPPESRCE